MAHLHCKDHGKRVMVIETTDYVMPKDIPLRAFSVMHRHDGEVCDSLIVTIDDEVFEPIEVIDWGKPVLANEAEAFVEDYLNAKHDNLIYA